jgi:transcriptional regulator with XRE-family HTH domain
MSLKIARKIAGLSQKALALRAGVDHSAISRLESGDRNLRGTDYDTVVRLATALHLDPDELFTVVEAPRAPSGLPRRAAAR